MADSLTKPLSFFDNKGDYSFEPINESGDLPHEDGLPEMRFHVERVDIDNDGDLDWVGIRQVRPGDEAAGGWSGRHEDYPRHVPYKVNGTFRLPGPLKYGRLYATPEGEMFQFKASHLPALKLERYFLDRVEPSRFLAYAFDRLVDQIDKCGADEWIRLTANAGAFWLKPTRENAKAVLKVLNGTLSKEDSLNDRQLDFMAGLIARHFSGLFDAAVTELKKKVGLDPANPIDLNPILRPEKKNDLLSFLTELTVNPDHVRQTARDLAQRTMNAYRFGLDDSMLTPQDQQEIKKLFILPSYPLQFSLDYLGDYGSTPLSVEDVAQIKPVATVDDGLITVKRGGHVYMYDGEAEGYAKARITRLGRAVFPAPSYIEGALPRSTIYIETAPTTGRGASSGFHLYDAQKYLFPVDRIPAQSFTVGGVDMSLPPVLPGHTFHLPSDISWSRVMPANNRQASSPSQALEHGSSVPVKVVGCWAGESSSSWDPATQSQVSSLYYQMELELPDGTRALVPAESISRKIDAAE